MVMIELYFALAFCVALLTWVSFFLPVLKEAANKGVQNTLTESPILASLVFITITMLLAPFVVPVLFMPLQGEYFRLGLQRIVEEENE